jgi:tRNA(adenine34) deaminase
MNNELYIKKCLALARKSEMKNEIPVGAILTQNNIILAESHNLSINANDPTAHAEINVIRLACEKINNYRIKDSVLYTTLEPCLMCMGAICEARIETIVFGAYSSSESSIDEKFKILKETYALDHTPKFIGGILQKECSLMLRNFFKRKRG